MRGLRPEDYVKIAVDTMMESGKDFLDLENRRPAIYATACLLLDILEEASGTECKSRGIEPTRKFLLEEAKERMQNEF